MRKLSILCFALCVLFTGRVVALELSLSIQPVLPKSEILKAYQPLADYLSAQTGHSVGIKAHANFLTYWSDMRRSKEHHLVLDAAHFTDYRARTRNYDVLAKLPDSVSFSIVTHEDELVFDVDELVLKKVATMVSPSVGAIRLLDLFKNPMRQPRIVYARDSNDAAQQVLQGKAYAAIIPTALVSRFDGLNTVMTTHTLPHMAFSASPDIPLDVRQAIKQALVSARETAAGQAMLQKLNFTAFEDAGAHLYQGYHALLKDMLGY